MRSFTLALAAAAAIITPAFGAQALSFAEWGFRVTFPADSSQRSGELRDRTIFMVSSQDGAYAVTAARYRVPITDPNGMLNFMTSPGSGETVVSSQPLSAPGAVGREIVMKRTPSPVSMSSGFELRRVFVRGDVVYRVTATYPAETADAQAKAFAASFALQ